MSNFYIPDYTYSGHLSSNDNKTESVLKNKVSIQPSTVLLQESENSLLLLLSFIAIDDNY